MRKMAGNGTNFRAVWQMIFSLLLFSLARTIAVTFTTSLYLVIAGRVPGFSLLTYDQEGAVTGVTGDGSAILQIVGFAVGAAVIGKTAKNLIAASNEPSAVLARAFGECREGHIPRCSAAGLLTAGAAGEAAAQQRKGEPVRNYLLLGAASLCAMMGLNMLLELSGLTNFSTAYREVAQRQYSVDIRLGLPLYVLAAPAAEELLFRGIVYNRLKSVMKPLAAMAAAAVLFGMYHGNAVQGIYGFSMACVMIYGYEYFGDFRVPLAVHSLVNLASYLPAHTPLAASGLVCWPVCALCLCLAAGGLFLLHRQRKVF